MFIENMGMCLYFLEKSNQYVYFPEISLGLFFLEKYINRYIFKKVELQNVYR